MSTVKENYQQLVETMKALGAVLSPATAAQYEAPPQSVTETSERGVKNPTLDIVIDPRRAGLSDEIAATAAALRRARALLDPHVPALHRALARWEGQDAPTE